MKHLEKITISNVRRFGERVEINIGKGATIFLAPNGTGKTAVFEAIELALTGRVKRLLFPPEPIIRDSQLKACIRLDFEDGKHCEAVFEKGSSPVLSGHHSELFQKAEQQDLPFLLQLTHFLNQQGNNWFVNSHGPEAGSQLDCLSIGREAMEVNQLIPSAKRAAGVEFSQAQREFEEVNEKWKQWLILLDKRSATKVGLTNELITKDSLLDQMNRISVQFKDFQVETTTQLFALKVLNADLKTTCDNKLQNLKNSLIDLQTFPSLVTDFGTLSSNLIRAKEKLVDLNSSQGTVEQILNSFKHELEEKNKEINVKELEVIKFKEIQRQNTQLLLLNTQHKSFEEKSAELDKEIKKLSNNQELTKKEIDREKENRELHETFRKRKVALTLAKGRIDELKEICISLRINITQVSSVKHTQIPDLKAEILDISSVLINAEKAELSSRENLEKAQTAFDALNKTADIIKSAVGTIIAEYPKDEGDCPVCGTQFQPDELQLRMVKTAQTLAPGLHALSDLIEKNKNEVEANSNITRQAKKKLVEKQDYLASLEAEVHTLTLTINQFFRENFGDAKSITEAEVFIETLIRENNESNDKLLEEIVAAPPPMSDEQFSFLTHNQLTLDEDLLSKLQELNKISVDLTTLASSIEAVSSKIPVSLDTDQISKSIASLEEEMSKLSGTIAELKHRVDLQSVAASSIKDGILKEELAISQLTTRITECRSRWANAKLSGEPSNEVLSQAIETLRNTVLNFENDKKRLEEIERELNKWQVTEEYQKTEDEIKDAIGEMTEEAYIMKLEKDLQEKKMKLEFVGKNVEILTVFSDCLSRELEVVHERIVSINPLWKKLLKRIIIDPRYGETKLDSFSYYKKKHANVNVQLHGENVLVSHVASEAQITDLQLTFMLAMAQKYQWTSWKSLLLDDPTQHHDLVHASAVFDLLRDYIIDFDFQILMATHDPVQAKFFMRKLENDGIPVNICSLYATENGVAARVDG